MMWLNGARSQARRVISILCAPLAIIAVGALATTASAQESPEHWFESGAQLIEARHQLKKPSRAKNIILFVGDGMSLTTVSAARILEGQQLGGTGEEHFLFFEQFPNVALSKTYNTNQQTPDSAGTMTAMATGVKSFAGAISVDATATRGDCSSMHDAMRPSLMDLANWAGLATGIVTTTRITHATPAALYAKAAERRWESDRGLSPTARAQGCADIAKQLVSYNVAGGLDLVFGGGRRAFYPETQGDPEYPDLKGLRLDGVDLIHQWQHEHPDGQFVWNTKGFDAIEAQSTGPLLALFEPGHMQYEVDRPKDPSGEPSLTEMVTKAIDVLAERGDQGYVLVVESGRIDHAHHANNAWRALTDTIEFASAIKAATEKINLDDTLVIVTADHAHALTFDGYGERGNPIMGYAINPQRGEDGDGTMRDHLERPMTVLNYANGPGFRRDDSEIDYRQMDPLDTEYKQNAGYWQYSATHAGEDVPVYAIGASSEVVYGVIEQNVLFHMIVAAHPALEAAVADLRGSEGKLPPYPLPERRAAIIEHD